MKEMNRLISSVHLLALISVRKLCESAPQSEQLLEDRLGGSISLGWVVDIGHSTAAEPLQTAAAKSLLLITFLLQDSM